MAVDAPERLGERSLLTVPVVYADGFACLTQGFMKQKAGMGFANSSLSSEHGDVHRLGL